MVNSKKIRKNVIIGKKSKKTSIYNRGGGAQTAEMIEGHKREKESIKKLFDLEKACPIYGVFDGMLFKEDNDDDGTAMNKKFDLMVGVKQGTEPEKNPKANKKEALELLYFLLYKKSNIAEPLSLTDDQTKILEIKPGSGFIPLYWHKEWVIRNIEHFK